VPTKATCSGPAAYWDPTEAPGPGGQSGVSVELGPQGGALDSAPTPGRGCGAGDAKKNTAKCGCLVPAPGGWAPPPPPAQGNRSGYSVPGYTPNGYGPNGYARNGYAPYGYAPGGYVPGGYAPTGSPNPYPYPNTYPSRTYPGAYAPTDGYPSGYYPPSTGNAPAVGNLCASPSGYGPAGYPVVDANGRLLCRVTATNTAPGVGVNLNGW
jgi:hypothetical protein